MVGMKYEDIEILDSKYETYDISVCIVTYNHSKYIHETLNSVFKQKTNCSYEIVIGDDVSPDNTQEILRSYWGKYPEKISLLLNKKNLGLSQNIFNVFAKAKGKYLIVLYGDDYWIDDNKLETQYNYLESHKEYIGVTTPIESIYSGEKEPFRVIPLKFQWNKRCTLKKYLKGYDFPMAGAMFSGDVFRNNSAHFYKMVQACPTIDDASFCILLLQKGDIYILGEITGAYRCFRKEQGALNFNSINSMTQKSIKQIKLYSKLNMLSEEKLNLDVRYGMVLASAYNAKRKNEISENEYRQIEESLDGGHKTKAKWLLVKGLLKKIEVNYRFV